MDFSGQNLRGRNFRGQDLTGANFSHADIRGANFSNAILRGTDFTGAKAGLQKRWAVSSVILSLLLSAFSGFFSGVAGYFAIYYFIPGDNFNPVAGGIVLLIYTVFFTLTIRQGIAAAFGFVVIAFAGAFTLLSAYIAWRTLKGDEKFALIRTISVAFGAIGGTSFCGADLTDADFTKAILKSTNFNHTQQKQTILHQVY